MIVEGQEGETFAVTYRDVIPVDFGPDDLPLFNYVLELAKKNRRNPDQQILHMLDCHFVADREQAAGNR